LQRVLELAGHWCMSLPQVQFLRRFEAV
jgi:hypothetical protein